MTVKLNRIAAAISLTAVLGFSTAFAAPSTDAASADVGQSANSNAATVPNTTDTTQGMPQAGQSTDNDNATTAPNATDTMQGMPQTEGTDTDTTTPNAATNSSGTTAPATAAPANASPAVNAPTTNSPTTNGANTDTSAVPAGDSSNQPQNAAPTTNAPASAPTTSTPQAGAIISQNDVLDFAQKAALASFSYDYSNYQQDMNNMQQYFSKTGWESFSKALAASNNLDVVQKEKLTVSAVLDGQPTVTQQQQTATGQEWQVEVPITVTYKNDKNQQIQQNLKVKMIVQTVSTDINPQGIGINQFIAMPASKATATEKSS